jgi:hypothetical protein
MQYIDGGIDNLVFIGGCIAVGLSILAVGVAAVAGFCTAGPVGAAAAAAACAKAVAPLFVGGVLSIALALRY